MQKEISKILTAIVLTFLMAGCDSDNAVYKRDYSFVADYLNEQGCVGCVVNKLIHFQCADKGITGGLYMYDFAVSDAEGNKWDVTYTAYRDLNPNTVNLVKKKKSRTD